MHITRKPISGLGPNRRLRAALYARYSSDLQSEASISDQFVDGRRYCAQQGFEVVAEYEDAAQSGSSTLLRPGYQRMVLAAEAGEFDVLVCESPDRLSRRLSDIAILHDRFTFCGIAIHVPSLGAVTTMHVGIMGMIAQVQLADLGAKNQAGSGRAGASRADTGGLGLWL